MELLEIERKIDNVIFSKSTKEMAKHCSGAACVYGLRSNFHSKGWPYSYLLSTE